MNGQTDIKSFNSAGQSLDYLKAHVKGQLLDRIQTGDPIYDTIIAFFLLSSQDTIIQYISISWKFFSIIDPHTFISIEK